jgi:DNA-binding PadR family transcriptional regulator
MKADIKRDILRRTILELLEKGSKHYTELDKKVCASCHQFATTNTFRSQFNYLLNNECIERIARGVYQITSRGKKYLNLLTK